VHQKLDNDVAGVSAIMEDIGHGCSRNEKYQSRRLKKFF